MSQIADAETSRRDVDFDDEPGFADRISRGRSKRNVIVDDSFDDDFPADDPSPRTARHSAPPHGDLLSDDPDDDLLLSDAPAPRRSRGRIAPAPQPAQRSVSHGSIWRWAIFATLVWVGAVAAFTIGSYRLSLGGVGPFVDSAGRLDPHILAIVASVAIGPLSLIWMAAIVARQAKALRVETRFLQDAMDRLATKIETSPDPSNGGASIAFTSGQDAAALKREADEAVSALQQLEESFIAAEQRARSARERMEVESYSLAQIFEGERGPNGAARADKGQQIAEFAAMVANALAASGAAQNVIASAPAASPGVRTVSVDESPEIAKGFEDAHAAVMRASAPAAAEPIESSDQANSQIEALRRRVVETAASGETVRQPEPRRDAPREEPRPTYTGPSPAHDGERGGMDWRKFVRAANFPDSEEDRETLDALYAVLSDSDAAALLQSAEDALSGLADIGLFMEDMRPHHAPADIWRRVVVDKDMGDAMELGGVRDPHAIEDVINALNDRPDFEVTSTRFLERYEQIVARLFQEGQEPELVVQLADTRSGRAYMLLGRSSGRFG